MKKFNEFINEGVRDKMTPKPIKDVLKSLDKLSPYEALATAKKYKIKEAITNCLERVKPIEEKLYKDIEQYDRSNLIEFMTFINKWIKKQGGTYNLDYTFNNLVELIENSSIDDYEDLDENDVIDGEVISIYSDKTVNLFKNLVVSFAIDELISNFSEHPDGEDEEDEDEEIGPNMNDDDVDEGEDEDEWDEEEWDEDEGDEPTQEELDKLQKDHEEKMRLKKEKENKPVNRIKNFLGF
jgi:hypothetical protein